MMHEHFAKELTRFAQACSRGDAGQALASRSALLLHDKEVQADLDRCAADTTAADLAQEIEFLKAENEGTLERAKRLRRDIIASLIAVWRKTL